MVKNEANLLTLIPKEVIEVIENFNARDYAACLKELRPLAEQGYPSAQYMLGCMYDDGLGVTQDDKETVKWFQLAAEQGYVESQFNLGLMYQAGYGVTQDKKKAINLFTEAIFSPFLCFSIYFSCTPWTTISHFLPSLFSTFFVKDVFVKSSSEPISK